MTLLLENGAHLLQQLVSELFSSGLCAIDSGTLRAFTFSLRCSKEIGCQHDSLVLWKLESNCILFMTTFYLTTKHKMKKVQQSLLVEVSHIDVFAKNEFSTYSSELTLFHWFLLVCIYITCIAYITCAVVMQTGIYHTVCLYQVFNCGVGMSFWCRSGSEWTTSAPGSCWRWQSD